MSPPAKPLIWIVAALLTALAVTVAHFERQQAARQDAVFGSPHESR